MINIFCKRRALPWLLAVAFFFNLVAGVITPSSQAWSATATFINNSGPYSVVSICTPNGIKFITLSADGTPVQDAPITTIKCDYCLPLFGGNSFVPASQINVPALRLSSLSLRFNHNIIDALNSVLITSHPPRAPPVQIFPSEGLIDL